MVKPQKARTIFVIEQGSYSDYHVVGVFSSRRNAELVQSQLTSNYDAATIAEWPLDPLVTQLSQGYTAWAGEMLFDGTMERCEHTNLGSYNLAGDPPHLWKRSTAPYYKDTNVQDCLQGIVLAKNPTHAIKIFNEYRTQMIALGKWKDPKEVVK